MKYIPRLFIGIIILFVLGISILLWGEQIAVWLFRGYSIAANAIHPASHASSRIVVETIPSTHLRRDKELRVYLPPTYDHSQQHYPTLYLLHGDPGSSEDWLLFADLQTTLDQLISSGQLPPTIVVFPDGNGPEIEASQYVNATTKPQRMEDYIIEDIVPYIDTHYRTLATRESRAIGGLSSGAYGAINLGLHHNDLFSVILSLSGYFDNYHGELDKVFGKDRIALAYNSPKVTITQSDLAPTSVFLAVGNDDAELLRNENQSFSQQLGERAVVHVLEFIPGGHDWEMWRVGIRDGLRFFGSQISTNE